MKFLVGCLSATASPVVPFHQSPRHATVIFPVTVVIIEGAFFCLRAMFHRL
ncbi:hypothetical protein [Xenorhabdus taiwanensis]|uniref:hypothetical protein n=1 Tax=Xenorhabdus taiwanensis TaxID=3085177 RepID=UPI0035A5DB3F